MNAYATAGAYIFINKGFIEQTESIEEVYGVMAHEIAHISQRHVIKSTMRSLGIGAGILIGSIFVDPSAIGWLHQGLQFQGLHHSRSFEYEADRVGVALLHRAQVPAVGMLSFFERLSSKENGPIKGASKALSFLSTHPMPEDRAAILKELIQKDPPSYTGYPITLSELKTNL